MAVMLAIGSFAQNAPAKTATRQFMLIVRFRSDFVPPAGDTIAKNIKAWQDYMGELGKAGKIVSGFRPANNGETISGTTQTTKPSPYIANNELVSSFLIINAKDMNEARVIAKKCPVFEFNGSVEIREIQNTAN
ncbi:hypothetical protein BEL04_03250 [Mucilaginibacter sp. PPCGB 2223]|nr:hypothetical protein BEL04_03250 [Mucilaginibacter sp. PPCGB 2223]